MKLKRRQLSLYNVVGCRATINDDNDLFDQVAKFVSQFKELLVQMNIIAVVMN